LVSRIEGGTWAEWSENRVLRKISGTERDEVIGEWRKLHNEKLNDLYFSLSLTRVSNQEE
jgi:hypothetical protein